MREILGLGKCPPQFSGPQKLYWSFNAHGQIDVMFLF